MPPVINFSSYIFSIYLPFSCLFIFPNNQLITLHCFLNVCTGTICSKNGACRYTDPSGNILLACTILDTTCAASCDCDPGYGGKDCSLSPSSLAVRDKLRYSLTDFSLSLAPQTSIILVCVEWMRLVSCLKNSHTLLLYFLDLHYAKP